MKTDNIYAQFYVRFNHNTQSLKFIIHSVTLTTFENVNDCGAYFEINEKNPKQKTGLLGYVHLPHISREHPYWHELLTHEVTHLIFAIIASSYKTLKSLLKDEEKIATMMGDIVGKFWKKYTNI